MTKINLAERIVSHIRESGCDDVLNGPFFCARWDETLLLLPLWQELFRSQIGAAITQNPVSVGSLCSIAVPKSRYTFRTVAHMSLLDTLKYTALVFSMGKNIEANRLKSSVVFSNRYNSRKTSLDRSNYDRFRQQSKKLSDSGKYKVKVVTDIANFYDRINLHKLENILNEKKCDPVTVSKINTVLLQWSQQQSYGIPVGSDASRLLAEAMLINADNELASHRIKFIRYVDDYRIFCSSQEKAYEAMQLLDKALRREGLFLNSGKTKLIDLNREREEKELAKEEFDPLDLEEKIEAFKTIHGTYSSRIAKYYRYPGKETAKSLANIDMTQEILKISDPSSSEDDLKRAVKAAIYQDSIEFSNIEKIIDLYPHLIPYTVDAIVKEFERDKARMDPSFIRKACSKYKKVFRTYLRNDYFRIQAARLLCTIDPKSGSFLSKELLKPSSGGEPVFTQTVMWLGDKIPRPQFLDMLHKYSSLGPFARSSLAWLLYSKAIIDGEERRASMKHLAAGELDPLLAKLLRSR